MTALRAIVDQAAWDESIRLYAIANGHRDAGRVELANEWQAEAVRAWMRSLGRDTTTRAGTPPDTHRAVVPMAAADHPARSDVVVAAVGERGIAPAAAQIGGERA